MLGWSPLAARPEYPPSTPHRCTLARASLVGVRALQRHHANSFSSPCSSTRTHFKIWRTSRMYLELFLLELCFIAFTMTSTRVSMAFASLTVKVSAMACAAWNVSLRRPAFS